jgi:hypothetical protein
MSSPYDGERILQMLHRGCKLQLRRELMNRWDTNAIEILTEEGLKIGYVPRYRNQEIGAQMDVSAINVIVSCVNLAAPAYEKVSVHCWSKDHS